MRGKYRSSVKKIAGREEITDRQILRLMKQGWWDNQIREKYKCGLPRLRDIRRANFADDRITPDELSEQLKTAKT